VTNSGIPIGSIAVRAATEPERATEEAPASEVRPVEGRPAGALRVFMCVRGPETSKAWLTLTDDAGATLFEGWLCCDDGIEIPMAESIAGARVRLHLETERWHRQAQVVLEEGLTEHVFV
jgi:hypothetical protein